LYARASQGRKIGQKADEKVENGRKVKFILLVRSCSNRRNGELEAIPLLLAIFVMLPGILVF